MLRVDHDVAEYGGDNLRTWAELAFVIGKCATNVPAAKAMDYEDDLKRTGSRETPQERELKGLKRTAPQIGGKYAQVCNAPSSYA